MTYISIKGIIADDLDTHESNVCGSAELLERLKLFHPNRRPAADISNNLPEPSLADRIINEVCREYSIAIRRVSSLVRCAKCDAARDKCYLRLRRETDMSWPQIAKKLGRKSGDSAVDGYERHRLRMMEDA